MFPIKGEAALMLAVVFGFAFGWLLNRGKVTSYNVIVNQFRFRDFTVLKVMMTAIVVGGVGVLILKDMGLAKLHIRDANMFGTIVGAAIFGVGMVLYGYCPGTGVAAVATGSVHALIGVIGMLIGAVFYAFSFSWVKVHILSVWALGKVSLYQLWGVSPWLLYGGLVVGAGLLFFWVEKQKL